MKAYRESRGIAPFILNFGIRVMLMANSPLQRLYPRGKKASIHEKRGWVGPRVGLDVSEPLCRLDYYSSVTPDLHVSLRKSLNLSKMANANICEEP
jgi:hypothetical protein